MPRRDASPDLIVLSHLRWPWVWQRPQHLVSRFAGIRRAHGACTWFVEEPVSGEVAAPVVRCEDVGPVTRIWLEVPAAADDPQFLGFDAPAARDYGRLLCEWLVEQRRPQPPDVLLYTPMALDIAEQLGPRTLAYDVMDDLASFRGAPQGLVLRQRRALSEADVVFAGGRSLHASVSAHRRAGCHLFPSGVETAHYASARAMRRPHHPQAAGYVGVIDERLDLGVIDELASSLPDWTIRMVGPVAKIDPASLPSAPNIEYAGLVGYRDLPAVMASLDVGLMPFALNDATRSISPTKTLEYLAAGLPVVSTRVPDVVHDFGEFVRLAGDGQAFAVACRSAALESVSLRDKAAAAIKSRYEWDAIAAEMSALMAEAARPEVDARRALA
jgi:glycosyltransferase involved in cell wall biosynthesis